MTTDTKDLDYQKLRSSFELNIPSDFNFAFDVLSKNALNIERIALISIDKNGDDFKNITHKELDDISSKFANALLHLGLKKQDKILVILPRIPEWYGVLFGCAKMGAIAMPGTTLLTARDIEYRVKISGAKAVVVSQLHCEAVEKIKDQCP